MEIFIKKLNGKSISIDVQPTDTVATVKDKIKEKEQLSSSVVSDLIFLAKPLEDDKKLQDYSIRQGSTLHLFLRLRGGC